MTMEAKPNASVALSDDQLAALDIMQAVAEEGLDDDDRVAMQGLADVIAGRTFDETQSRAFFEELRAEIQNRHK